VTAENALHITHLLKSRLPGRQSCRYNKRNWHVRLQIWKIFISTVRRISINICDIYVYIRR